MQILISLRLRQRGWSSKIGKNPSWLERNAFTVLGYQLVPRHAEITKVPYHPHQMFELVADVAQYPKFLPWCIAARIRSKTDTLMVADLTIGFGPFRESFTSRIAFDRPGQIQVSYENGPFKYLKNVWRFRPDSKGCEIDFFVDFEFRSRVLQVAIGAVFHEATRLMVNAFIRRAREIYGKIPEAEIVSKNTDQRLS